MTEAAAATVLLFAFVVIVATGYVLPWAVRLACLYELHTLRDELFVAAEDNPELREARVFRSVDRAEAYSIHLIRDRSHSDLAKYVNATRRRKRDEDPDPSDDEVVQYELELESMPAHLRELIIRSHKRSRLVLTVAVGLGHPVVFAVLLVGIPVAVVAGICIGFFTRETPPVAVRIAQIESATDQGTWGRRRPDAVAA
jgi:hypothetical protein